MLFFFKFIIFNVLLCVIKIDIIKGIPIILSIILAVAFFTVLERKVLAAMQRRRGPNIIGIYGLLQAIADAVKLLAKETLIPGYSNIYIFIISPIFTFFIAVLC